MGVTATGGDLFFGNAALKSTGNMDLTAATGSMTFDAGVRQGVQSAAGDISLFAGTDLINAGIMTADAGDILVRVDGDFRNSGSMHAYGLLDVGGKTTANSESVDNTGNLLSGSMHMGTGMLRVTDGGSMESTGDMDVTVTSGLTVGGTGDSTSRILAATSGSGAGNIVVSSNFINYGMLYSGYDLDIQARFFQNESTGGISAAHNLIASSQGSLTNAGALYAGNDLIASASQTFNNDSTPQTPLATIGSGHDTTITANSFINSSYIDAANNITITAKEFKNQVQNGAIRSYNNYQEDRTSTFLYNKDHTDYYRIVFYVSEYFLGGPPAFTPHINGGGEGTVTIQGFDSGLNLGSSISGNNVKIIGNSGSSFDNTDIVLNRKRTEEIKLDYEDDDKPDQYASEDVTVLPTTIQKAYIRAENLYVDNVSLANSGSPSTGSPAALTATGTTFLGLTLNLPTNPNGMFVTNKSSNASYLVESNPLYADIDNFLGSEYLLAKYNFDSDEVLKRLGDAGYETYLVGQQLASKTGGNLLPEYSNEKEQMQGLMDSAANQAGTLGLKMGTKLSAYQQSLLTEDMLWMVETVVDGQKVLAPVVYLAASTKQMFASSDGTNISATTANLNLKSLTNTGGSISANTLNVTTKGDITNTSGTISGDDVALSSTDGSILNMTLVMHPGSTTMGKTGSIVSTGDLKLDAAKNITNLGANIAAEGNADLTAGNNVVLDTMQRGAAAHTHSKNTDTTYTRTKQIGSTLSSGGNLTVTAKKDITVAGSSIKAGGNADLDAGEDINILARNNSKRVATTKTKSGLFVSGGLYGKETKTTERQQTKAVGSTVSTGNDMNLSAKKTATLQGAKLNAKGDVTIAGTDLNVLEARDTASTKTHIEKISILSFSGGDGDTKSSSTDASVDTSGKVQASASTSATNDAGGIDLLKTTTTDSLDKSTTAVASQINANKNLTLTGKSDVTLRGAEVTTGGDANLSGENVNILAAQDTHVATSKTTTVKVGLYASTTNSADAEATAGASANAKTGSANAGANATATANANSSTSIDLLRTKTTTDTTTDIVNKGTTLASGGNLTINSKKDLVVQGSDLSGETGVDITAKDMSFLAAEDSHTSTSSTTKTSSGLYIDGKASAKAQTSASANAGLGANAGVSASGSVKAELSVGVQQKVSKTTNAEGSTTARVSSITSGSGSIARTAENGITDVGTAIEAGGDFSQTAKTYDSRAAANTSYKTSTSTSDTAKIGVYAKADAGVTASAGVGLDAGGAEAGAGAKATAKVGAGIKASYSRDDNKSASASSEAVVSTIKTGGKITSVTSGKTTLEGTQLSGGQGVALEAGSLDFKAAENTETSSSSDSNVNAAMSAGLTRGSGKGFEASVSGGTSKTDTNANSTTAVAGGISSGGNITIKTKGDTRLEGTNLSSTGDTAIDAGGSITFDAAKDTASSSTTSYDASASVNVGDSAGGGSGKSNVDAKVAGGYSKETASSVTATAGSIATGGNLTLNADKAVTLEGTNMAASGDATISGAEGVAINAAHSTSESKSTSVRAGLGVGTSKSSNAQGTSDGKSVDVTAEVGHSKAEESTAAAGSLSSGGNLVINSGKDVNLEGTDLAAGNKASINAGGDVNFEAAESTSKSSAVGVALSTSASKTNKTTKTTPQTPAAKTGTGGTQGSDGSAQSNEDLATWQDKHGTVMQQLKAKQAVSGTGADKGQATTPPVASPNAQADGATVSTAVTEEAATAGIQFRKKNQTVQQAGSVSAGAGGIEINASGGDVNLVGTNMTSSGDVGIVAKDDVNITATKNTESGFGITIAGSVNKKTEKPIPAKSSQTTAKAMTPSNATQSKQVGAATKTKDAAKTGAADQLTGDGLSIGTDGAKSVTSSEWKVENGVFKSTAEDTDNTSSGYVGIGGGSSTRNEGATINADGALNITAGGKTTLVNTDVEAASGENIDAAGGIERRTVEDTTLLNVDSNSGPAAVNEGVSTVPVYDQSNAGAATTPGAAPATGVVPPLSMKNVQNGGAVPPRP